MSNYRLVEMEAVGIAMQIYLSARCRCRRGRRLQSTLSGTHDGHRISLSSLMERAGGRHGRGYQCLGGVLCIGRGEDELILGELQGHRARPQDVSSGESKV